MHEVLKINADHQKFKEGSFTVMMTYLVVVTIFSLGSLIFTPLWAMYMSTSVSLPISLIPYIVH